MLRDMFSSEIEGRAILIRSDDAGHSLASNGVLARPDLLGVKGPTKMALEFNRLRESCAPEGAERMYLKSKFKTPKRSLIASFLALMLAGAPAQALEPMSEEKHINYSLISAAIGALIEETCPSIGRRNLTILSKTLALQNYALKKGYTRTQIKAYIKSKSAKDYVRAQAESYLAARGVVVGEKETYCAQGRAEIANKTLAGSLMRVRN
ncbi:MAG: DUF5333 domain-containing protein [Marinosulfonomonas sp.]|nr:DUF5333 domain-containing protein [Marinosulfonomonas sp.]